MISSGFDEGAKAALKLVADLTARLAECSQGFRTRLAALSTCFEVSVKQFESGMAMAAYIEADLDADRTLTWWLEISPLGNQWGAEARVLLNTSLPSYDRDCKVLLELGEKVWPSFAEVVKEAPEFLEQLLSTEETVRELLRQL